MKKVKIILFVVVVMLSCQPVPPGWKLVWEENFDNDGIIDEAVWSKIPRGRPDWQRTH